MNTDAPSDERRARRMVCLFMACVLAACSDAPSSASSAPPPAPEESDERSEAEPATPRDPALPSEDETAPPEVDLLRAVRSRVETSSVNNDDASQTLRLTDGNLETAWNSAPTDSPERIVIHLPDQVRVSAIALTAGYTRRRGRLDLFTANRRVQAVRVHHGEDVFEARLDIEDRALQRIDVDGGGGEWTVEITEWVDGTRPWRELVVSEIQVLGAAGANAPPYEAPAEAAPPEVAPPAGPPLNSKSAIRRALIAASTSFATLRSLMDLESSGFYFNINYQHGVGSNVSCDDANFEEDLILPGAFDPEEHWSPVLPENIPAATFSCLPDLSMCISDDKDNRAHASYVFEFRVNAAGRRHLVAVTFPPSDFALGDFSFFDDAPPCRR